MPVRATKRGDDRTRLDRDCDVLVCGASFAGLAVARELAGSGARVLVTLLHEMQKRNAKRGLATLCIGGGMGIAMCVER